MERMDMHSRNEYLKVLKEGYFRAGSKKEKSRILDEYKTCCCPVNEYNLLTWRT